MIGASGQVVVQNSVPAPTIVRAVTAQPQPQQVVTTAAAPVSSSITNSTQPQTSAIMRPGLQTVQQTQTSQTTAQTVQVKIKVVNYMNNQLTFFF